MAKRSQPPDASAPGFFQVMSLRDASNNSQQVRDYRRRRPHKKSRGGCSACKQRRVKCDQTLPDCLRCKRNNRECTYEGQESPAGDGPLETQPAAGKNVRSSTASKLGLASRTKLPSRAAAEAAAPPEPRTAQADPMVLDRNNALVVALNRPNFRQFLPQPFPDSSPDFGASSAELLHHFETLPRSIFGMPNFTGSKMGLAARFSHLRCTILTVAASHLYHKAPGNRGYYIARHHQQSMALQAYRQALATPLVEQGQQGVDALLLTAMFFNMLAFVMPAEESDSIMVRYGEAWRYAQPCVDPDPAPRRSWVFSPDPNRLGWLTLIAGLTPLLVVTQPWHEKSFLAPLFFNSDDERRILSGSWQSLSRVPQTWLDVFGIDRHATLRPRPVGVATGSSASIGATPESSTASSPAPSPSSSSSGGSTVSISDTKLSEADRLYRGGLRVLAELLPLPPNGRNLLGSFQFLGQLDRDFHKKLHERDEKALWLFGMWMGIMCRYNDVWWVRRRSRCDFRAIRLWLHLAGVGRRPGEEGRLWRILLNDLDNTWNYEFDNDPLMKM